MSTETTDVVCVPSAEDNQQHEKIAKEEDHAVEQGDAPPSKNDAEKHEKHTCEVENSEGPEASVTKSEETQVINQVEPPVVLEVEKADHVPVQNVEADHECQAVEKEEKIAIEAVEKVEKTQTIEAIENEESEKAQTTEAVVENEPEKIEPIEDDKNKLPVEKVAIEAVENEQEIQGSEACEKKEVKNIATEAVDEKESDKQATEACEDKAVEKIAIEAVETESEKTKAIETDEIRKEETPANEEQIDEKETTTDEGKTACELTTNEEAQMVEKEAGVVDNAREETMQCEKATEKEEESVKVAQATKESDEKTEEASFENEVKKSEDGTNELKNATDQVIEKPVEREQKSDRDLVEGLILKEDEYKDITVNGEEAKNDSKTDATPIFESCKDGDQETQAPKDQVQDVASKPAQKQSGNNIISKVKQSLVKVKKAIIGKSPSSKVLSPEIKGDQENLK